MRGTDVRDRHPPINKAKGLNSTWLGNSYGTATLGDGEEILMTMGKCFNCVQHTLAGTV